MLTPPAYLCGKCFDTGPVAAAGILVCLGVSNLRYAGAAALLVKGPAVIGALQLT